MDAIDLKDLIRQQRLTLQELKSEGERLRGKVAEQEKVAALTKQRHNVSSSIQSSAALGPDNLPSFDDKLLEADAKLEIRILCKEIRKALPLLEQEALMLESELHASERCAQSALKQAEAIPNALKKSDKELQDELRAVEMQVAALSEEMEREVREKTAEKEKIEKKVNRLRKDLMQLIEERMLAQESRDMYELAYRTELQRLETLRHQYDALSSRLTKS